MPPQFNLTPEHIDTIRARRETAREWYRANPQSDAEITLYYQTSKALPAELEAWHQEPTRASWTETIVEFAQKTERRLVVDIGCGLGHDLRALRAAGVMGWGVEPNQAMREELQAQGIICTETLDEAHLEQADLILLIDVLEHLNNPAALLATISHRTRLGTFLLEHTPTWDLSDPLHLLSNYGWLTKDHLPGLGWRFAGKPEWPVGCWLRV